VSGVRDFVIISVVSSRLNPEIRRKLTNESWIIEFFLITIELVEVELSDFGQHRPWR
jgi:hypothetical protein